MIEKNIRIYVENPARLGNNILAVYKGFKFATMLGVKFDNVFVNCQYNPLFKNIQ